MNNIVLHNNPDIAYTHIDNLFIDEYMPCANGSYVKVYLLIARKLSENCANVSIQAMADSLELTDMDVVRALKYWERCGLLGIKTDADGDIRDITVEKPAAKKPRGKTRAISSMSDIADEPDLAWTLNIVEKYMEQPLSPSDVELVVFLYENLGFSPELILHLYEHCISHGKKNSKYIEAVAMDWAKEGIDTVEKAAAYSLQYDARYMGVMKAFGLSQAPAPAQKKYIDSWLAMGFGSDVILEACNRTVLAINEPSFQYANGILEKWHKAGIHSLADIKNADKARAANDGGKMAKRGRSGSFEQRRYSDADYAALEKLLSN